LITQITTLIIRREGEGARLKLQNEYSDVFFMSSIFLS
jgi:hypothetical protein